MKRFAMLLILTVVATGCSTLQTRMVRLMGGDNPYQETPFYARYLNTGTQLDQDIRQTLDALELNPWYAPLHNHLGELLTRKGFPKDAELEFRRAVASDHRFYPAWYNLGLIREANGQYASAIHAFKTTLDYKPGHAAAHFQLGLLYEKRGRYDDAIDHYADAFRINEALLDVRVNPRILDSELVPRTLLALYPKQHAKESIQFEPTPGVYPSPPNPIPAPEPAPSPQAQPEKIVTPAPPVTNPGQQAPPPPATGRTPDRVQPPPATNAPSSSSESGNWQQTEQQPAPAEQPQAPPPTAERTGVERERHPRSEEEDSTDGRHSAERRSGAEHRTTAPSPTSSEPLRVCCPRSRTAGSQPASRLVHENAGASCSESSSRRPGAGGPGVRLLGVPKHRRIMPFRATALHPESPHPSTEDWRSESESDTMPA